MSPRLAPLRTVYDRRPRDISLHGIKLRISFHLTGEIVQSILTGNYEWCEFGLLKSILRPDDRVLELGTGLGFLTTFCARIVGGENVLTYEANPAMERHIRRTFRANGVAPTLRIAVVGVRDGQQTFYVSRSFWGSSTLNSQSSMKAVTAPSRSITEVMKEFRPTVVIMDVEGGEAELVPVMDFHGVRAIVIELHQAVIGDEATSTVRRVLREQGFTESASFEDSVYMLTRPDDH